MGFARCGGCVIAVAPEVAAEVPVLIGIAILLSLFLQWATMRGMKAAWNLTFGSILLGIADAVRIHKFGINLDPAGKLRDLDAAITKRLDDAIEGTEAQMGHWFHQVARLQLWIVDETWKIARDTAHAIDWLVTAQIPHAIHDATHALHGATRTIVREIPQIKYVIAKAPAAAKTAARAAIATTIPAVVIPHVGELKWIHRHWKALTLAVAAAGGLALPRPVAWPEFRRSWKEIEVWRKVTAKRLLRLEALLAASGLAVAVANMTGTRIACWRGKGNIARTLRHICGFPTWLVDLLVIGTVEAFIVSDLCRFTDLLIKEAESIRPALLELVDVEDALINCHGTTKPMNFALPPVSLPAVVGVSPLAA